jgi:hypothetical protein
MVIKMPARDNSSLVYQSSLAILPAETSEASRRNGRRSENFTYQYLSYLMGFLTCRKILRLGTSGFTFHPKEGVLRILIALKNPSSLPDFVCPRLQFAGKRKAVTSVTLMVNNMAYSIISV